MTTHSDMSWDNSIWPFPFWKIISHNTRHYPASPETFLWLSYRLNQNKISREGFLWIEWLNKPRYFIIISHRPHTRTRLLEILKFFRNISLNICTNKTWDSPVSFTSTVKHGLPPCGQWSASSTFEIWKMSDLWYEVHHTTLWVILFHSAITLHNSLKQ